MIILIHKHGHRVTCVTCTATDGGWWARPVGAEVRFFFSRNDWRSE